MRIGILGAGALGLTAGYRFASVGHHVSIYERLEVVGGLAAGFRIGDTWLERFYHHLFRSDRDIVALIDQLGLGTRLEWLKPITAVLWEGRQHQLDDPLSVLRFPPLSLPERLRLAFVLAVLKLTPSAAPFESSTASVWLRRAMGDRVTDILWEPLLRAKFGEYHASVSMAWFWARIYCRTPRLGYLRGGFQLIYEELAERVRNNGGVINLGRDVRTVRVEGDGVAIVSNGVSEHFDKVLITAPTRAFARLAPELPPEWLRRYDWGDWLGAHCVILGLDRPLASSYWLNVNDPGYPFLALVDHANLVPAADYGGLHPVYLGNYLPMSSSRFAQSDESIIAEYSDAIRRINPAFDPSWIRQTWVFKAPYAQPVVTSEYRRHIPPHRTPLRNVFLANMFQVYPQDRGQNYSVRMANRVAAMMLAETG